MNLTLTSILKFFQRKTTHTIDVETNKGTISMNVGNVFPIGSAGSGKMHDLREQSNNKELSSLNDIYRFELQIIQSDKRFKNLKPKNELEKNLLLEAYRIKLLHEMKVIENYPTESHDLLQFNLNAKMKYIFQSIESTNIRNISGLIKLNVNLQEFTKKNALEIAKAFSSGEELTLNYPDGGFINFTQPNQVP